MKRNNPTTFPDFDNLIKIVTEKGKLNPISKHFISPEEQEIDKISKRSEEKLTTVSQTNSIFRGVLGSSNGGLVLSTPQEYEDAVRKVMTLEEQIGNGWLDPTKQALGDEQQRIAYDMLMYEIEHDLLPL